jgi:hypothetical protein
VSLHVRHCEACQQRVSALEEQASCVREKLDGLAPETAAVDPHAAYDRYLHAYQGRGTGVGTLLARLAEGWRRPLVGGFAVACALVIALSFSPGRTWAQRVLEMLRVQKVAVVPVDLSALTAQNGNGHEHLLAQFISDNVTVTMKPGPSVTAADVASASQMAGFTVRTLEQLGTPQKIQVRNQGAFQMTLDHDRMQAVLDQGGRSDIQIPATVDGSLIAVHVPKAVHLGYGNCGKANGAATPSTDDSCINFVQVPSPIVSIPPGFNIAALAEAALQIAGMSASEAHSYAQTVDWSSTLVIPVPQTGGSYRTVAVDGVNGTLIESAPHGSYAGTYELIWVKNGIVYSLGGRGTSDRAVAAAASLS